MKVDITYDINNDRYTVKLPGQVVKLPWEAVVSLYEAIGQEMNSRGGFPMSHDKECQLSRAREWNHA